jgi:hypothetical protein
MNLVLESIVLSSLKVFVLEIKGAEKLLKLCFSVKTSHS